jgi:hypothetical protein
MESLSAKVDATSSRVSIREKRLEAASTLFNAFDPDLPVGHLSGNLPHWRQESRTYFVTFRTADSLPQEKLDQWLMQRAEWSHSNPEPTPRRNEVNIGSVFPLDSSTG